MKKALPVLVPDRQVAFFLRLEQIRSSYLAEALRDAVQAVTLADIDDDLKRLVPEAALTRVASFGFRGEVFFATPSLLRVKPMLLGYYRLLFGASQKFFYRGDTFGAFKAMEERGFLSKTSEPRLDELCATLAQTGTQLVDRLGNLSLGTVHELQLLTLGPQFKGGENNVVGEEAVKEFASVLERLIEPYLTQKTSNSFTFENASGRTVFVKIGSDPDVDISEMTPSGAIPLVAIEVKGGRDNANKHNRLGEAEKSHLTARLTGHTRFWTVVMVDYASKDVREKSPSTQEFWRLDKIKDFNSAEHHRFRDMLGSVLGLRAN
jgi:hypothetical protein